MKIVSIVGARPQFIKAAVVSRALRARHREILLHTGQHYDDNMSDVFFREMEIPHPDINLEIGSGSHGAQTAAMLKGIEEVLFREKPDWVLVYGDTNSTLAGALAACKLRIPIAHVEAGLRSHNRGMPEEHNRVLTDHCADLLFCPTETAIKNAKQEGLTRGVVWTGDVMLDAVLYYSQKAEAASGILSALKLEPGAYALATIHRPANTDDPKQLFALLRALDALERRIVLPLHPRTKTRLGSALVADALSNVQIVDPVGYFDMLLLEKNAAMIFTDSGGVQKEAYFHGVPCVTLRAETEWVETVASGWNRLAPRPGLLPEVVRQFSAPPSRPAWYGDGHAAEACVAAMEGNAWKEK